MKSTVPFTDELPSKTVMIVCASVPSLVKRISMDVALYGWMRNSHAVPSPGLEAASVPSVKTPEGVANDTRAVHAPAW